MQRHGAVPNLSSYNALVSDCQQGKQPEYTMGMFHAMQWHGMVPSMVSYSAMISACEKGRQPA